MSTLAALPMSNAIPATRGNRRIGHYLLLLYVFLMVSRMPEIAFSVLHTSLYQILIMSLVLTIAMLFSGTVFNLLHTRVGVNLLILHVWFVIASLFSSWHTGSLDAMGTILRYLPMAIFMAAFIVSVDQCRNTAVVISLAVLTVLIWTFANPSTDLVRLSVKGGSFGNPNELAIHLSICGPFLAYTAASKRCNVAIRRLAALTIVLAIFQILRTGSRGGLITTVLLTVIYFFSVRIATRLKMAAIAAAFGCMAVTVVPAASWARLGTLVSDNASEDTREAVASAHQRRALLIESIELTLEHPLLGVGPGVYAPAAADRAKALGEHASWQVAHNAYTQLSAESGIPGLLLFLITLGSILTSVYRMRKRHRHSAAGQDQAMLAGCILLSAIAFCVNALFTSMATEIYFYLIGGFGVVAARLNGEAERARGAARHRCALNSHRRSHSQSWRRRRT